MADGNIRVLGDPNNSKKALLCIIITVFQASACGKSVRMYGKIMQKNAVTRPPVTCA
jgi:hypothetical protein